MRSSCRQLAPHLQRAHAGRTQDGCTVPAGARPSGPVTRDVGLLKEATLTIGSMWIIIAIDVRIV
jgi:hypothetical protein